MKNVNAMLAEAYASWLSSLSSCCAPLTSCLNEKHYGYDEKEDFEVWREQPEHTAPLSFEPVTHEAKVWAPSKERAPRKSLGSLSRKSFSVRRRFTSNASSTRRPHISAPTNFRHLNHDTFQFPLPYDYPQPRARPTSFRPIELSIYMPDNALSPIMNHFDYTHPDVPPPPAAHMCGSAFDSDSITLGHERSYSSMSFHIPRRPVTATTAPSLASEDNTPPRIPPRSRARAYTSPSVERIVERIASAMIERDFLQSEIESVIERQSIYTSSRPTTAYGLEDVEPMPSIPALPAAAPSFAERLSTERPQTAPSKPIEIPHRRTPFADASAAFTTPPRQRSPPPPRRSSPRVTARQMDLPLAPPLPLVLRPPLRKKKSFSRVSNWLFPGGEDGQHQREMSLDSVTNLPKPITGRDGFYQCVAPGGQSGRRTSVDSIATASTWTTEEDRTVPTTWSPGSSPVTKQTTPTSLLTVDRSGLFGVPAKQTPVPVQGPRPQSVGVAF